MSEIISYADNIFPYDFKDLVPDNNVQIRDFNRFLMNMKSFDVRLVNDIKVMSVASDEVPESEKSKYDYPDITTAISETIRSINLTSGHTILNLETGTHYFTDPLGRPTVSGLGIPTYQINHAHITVQSMTGNADDVILTFGENVEFLNGTLFRVESGRLNFYGVTFDMTKSLTDLSNKYVFLLRYSGGYSFVSQCKFKGWETRKTIVFTVDPNTGITGNSNEFTDLATVYYTMKSGSSFSSYYEKFHNVKWITYGLYNLSGSFIKEMIDDDCEYWFRSWVYYKGAWKLLEKKESMSTPNGGICTFSTKPFVTEFLSSGPEEDRVDPNEDESVGFRYFNTTTNKPNFWTGSKWVHSDGSDA